MSDQTYPVLPGIAAHAHVTAEQHRAMTEQAHRDPEAFWMEQSSQIVDGMLVVPEDAGL